MKVKFWGVRGSIATPTTSKEIQDKIKEVLRLARPSDIVTESARNQFIHSLPFRLKGTYGGNTTCLEVRSSKDDIFILDAGTGVRPLGISLLSQGRMSGQGEELNFIFTHTHWDHIQGLMFFLPIHIPKNKIIFNSCVTELESRLRYQQSLQHAPITFDDFGATTQFNPLQEEVPSMINGLKVTGKYVKHPGGCYAYSLEEKNKKIVFCTDAEFSPETFDNIATYIEFFSNADVLIFDTQYTFEDSLNKIDWGHSSSITATDLAIASKVKKLILFHHEPTYSDQKMEEVLDKALQYKKMTQPDIDLEIAIAKEGWEIEI